MPTGERAMAIRDACEKRRSAMDSIRSGWVQHWRELSEYLEPRTGFWLYTTRKTRDRGGKFNDRIINEEGQFDLAVLSGGMQSHLSSRTRPWFTLTTADPALAERYRVKLWLSSTVERMFDILDRSNAYDTWMLGHRSLAAYGTNNESMVRDWETFVRWRHMPIGSYWVATDYHGRVRTCYEELDLTVDQVVTKYGLENCPDRVRDLWHRHQTEEELTVYQCVEWNDKRIPEDTSWRGKRYRSVHFLDGAPKDHLLRVSGFDQQPFYCSRWELTGIDAWGSSAGMGVLGSTKQLQVNELDLALLTGKIADPPTAVPKDFLDQRSSKGVSGGLKVGELIPVDEMAPSAGARAYTLMPPNPQIQEIRENCRDIEGRIRRGFFADVFMMMHLLEGGPERTAYELASRKEEKLQQLGPVVDRQHNERFSLEIMNLLGMMIEAGWVDPIPEELFSEPLLKIEYTSILAQAMKALGIGNMDRLIAITGSVSQLDPTARHRLDCREYLERYADMLGIDPSVVRSDEDVEAAVQQEIRAQQLQQALEMAKTGAEATKAASQAQLGNDTVLDAATEAAVAGVGAPQ